MIRRRSLSAALPVAFVLALAGAPPADATAIPKITWQGQVWDVRTHDGAPMAGPGYFRAFNVKVDAAGKLRMRVTRDARGLLSGAEVNTVKRDWGYGRYRIVMEGSPANWEPNHVFGFYALGKTPTGDTYELDTEAASWGWQTPQNWEHVLHTRSRTSTAWNPAFFERVEDQGHTKTLHDINWQRGRVTWDTYGYVTATATTPARWALIKRTVRTTGVPVPGRHAVGMNFWVVNAGPTDWRTAQTREVVISQFQFIKG